ncbi:theronine dehydrogenase-like Zn-dependent dehydrogenase [Cylindrospermum stagnale PCC 7417]|uniref:Theronine dehydrogenase-like Zn-dependent dehydrogenase n=1 Tax=Cylindrospermum stagnale PCC 7417 TaxID=56107 RepID=K9WUL5_9NOST|nr:alcohol dehydrogenase catalytic domain-containing protein [Cylindrospermum stagnale]AFZ24055.1 theronine dehydrogenase-like Zn-dependent dehydrogenase [Cylindrospermum stagnale PCC 7417]
MNSTTMQGLLLSDITKLELKQFPIPAVNSHNVLVKVQAVGLCGSDFHIFSGEANYNTDKRGRPIPLVEQPQILGHEIVGVVAEVGEEVEDLQIGDRVVLDQGLNCFSKQKKPLCEYCATGDSHQCQFYTEHGITGLPGGLAEYIALPAVNLIPINSDLDRVEAALTEPLGCVIHASDRVIRSRTRYAIGAEEIDRSVKSILICGGGPAGLMFIQYLRNVLQYDGLLLVSEPNAFRRELATGFGAVAIDPLVDDLAEVVEEKTNGRRVEYLIDASGAGSVFNSIPGLIRKQATILLYGYGHAGADVSVLNNLQFIEPTLVTATGASGGFDSQGKTLTYQKALDLLESKQINVGSLITHRYESLADVPQAFVSDHQNPDYIKGVAVL